MTDPTRTRTFHWPDPTAAAAAARGAAGVDFLRSSAGRHLQQAAPIAECLGFQLVEVAPGRVVFELTPAEFHYNPRASATPAWRSRSRSCAR